MAVVVAAVGSYVLKLGGMSLPESVLNEPRVQRIARLLAGGDAGRAGRHPALHPRRPLRRRLADLVGVAAAVVALLLRRGFLVVFFVGVGVTALLRLVT